MRSLCLLALGCLAGLILYTYDLKIRTRALEARGAELAGRLQDESDLLSLMRAETSYLSRPERIGELARTKLGFEPVSSKQIVPWSAVAQAANASWRAQVTDAPRNGIAALIERSIPASPATRR